MDDTPAPRRPRPVATNAHPISLMLLTIALTCFAGGLVTDLAYLNSGGNLIWVNFSSWLLASGLVFGALAGLALLIGAFRASGSWLPFVLLLAAWVIELLNSFVHARDGWTAVSPTGLVLSIIGSILALASAGIFAFRREPVAGAVS